MNNRGAAVRVLVPGKVMLTGEYTVLQGGTALAATVDRHVVVRVRGLKVGDGVQVGSSLWDAPRLAKAGAALSGEALLDAATHGAKLFGLSDVAVRVDSELDVKHGLGSSSAVRLGTLLALEELARLRSGAPPRRPKSELWPTAHAAYQLQKAAQKAASGYDVATQLLGGVVRFRGEASQGHWPAEATALGAETAATLPKVVHVYVGGQGAPTAKVMGDTRAWLAAEGRMAALEQASAALLSCFETALRDPEDRASVRALVKATAQHRAIMAGSPAFPAAVAIALAEVPGADHEWSFKTTGAGGEDALLIVGHLTSVQAAGKALRAEGWHRLPAGFDTLGTRIEREASHG